jgi:iron complex outermembrane recepter protein
MTFAQEAKVSGSVTTIDGKPAEFVDVRVKGTTKGATVDAAGNYEISQVPAGLQIIVASFEGLETQEQTIQVEAGKTTTVNFMLKETTQELQEVVISADPNRYRVTQPSATLRLLTPIIEVPQNIQVVSNKVLADQQVVDMLEGVTRNVSGVTRAEHWDNYAYIIMRGSQIASFRNGMNVQMPWGPLAEDMSMVDRIEFVKGPAGFMMANGEPSGFYNVVTKKPTGKNKGEASMTLGSFDMYRASIDLDGVSEKNSKLQYRFNVMGQLKGSYRDFEYTNRASIVPVIRYQFSDKTTLTAEYTYQYMQQSMIGSNYVFSQNGYGDLPREFTTAEGNMDPTNINDHSIFLTLNHQLSKNWKLTGQVAYLYYNQIGASMWPWGFTDSLGTMQRGISIWDALGLSKQGQFFVNGDFTTGVLKHRVLGGLDMNHKDYYADWSQGYAINGTQEFNIYDPQYGMVPSDSLFAFDRSKSIRQRGVNYNQGSVGLYVQDEIRFWGDKIRLTLAGRYTTAQTADPYSGSTNDQKFTPRFGLSVSPIRNLSVYALYDQAFVPQGGFDYYGKKFDPITGDNREAGIKRDWFNGRWNTTVSAYRITKNNVVTSDPEHINFSIQLGQTQTKGVELDITGRIIEGLDVTINYAYTDSRVTKDTDPTRVGVAVAGTTKHIQNTWISYSIQTGILKGLGASIGYQYQGDRSSWYVFDGTKKSLPNYFRTDGSIHYTKDHIRIALNVNNITDAYLYSGAPYGDYYYWQTEAGRNFRLSMTYRF